MLERGRCGGGNRRRVAPKLTVFGPNRFVFPVQSWHLMAISGDTCGLLTRSRKGKITVL